jgi:uncharacterized HAD superfamily protein
MLKIGIDLDDTITDTYPTFLSLVSVYYGMDYNKLLKNKPTYKELHRTLPDFEKFIDYCYHVMAKIVPLKENVIEVLNKLKERGCEIIIITARNSSEYTSPYKISYDYLNKMGVPFDKIIADAKDKGLECVNQGIDVFIDDSVFNCRAVRKKGIRVIRYDSGSKYKDNSLETARSWNEVYDLIMAE